MDSVSRPLLIALGAMVALLAIWLVALKPKPVEIDSTPLAPTQAIPKAQAAAGVSDDANARLQAATGGSDPAVAAPAPAGSTPGAAPAPASAPERARHGGRRLDGPILRDIAGRKVVVVLFWNAEAADDVATRGALRGLDRHRGKVTVHVVPIGQVGRYPAITKGITIAQSPTTLIIGRKRSARAIAGLSEPRELAQAVDDALAGR